MTDIGMRAVLARDLMDVQTATKSDYASYDAFTDLIDRLQESTEQCLERSEKFINDYNGAADGRVRTWLDLQQVCNCSPELCTGVKKLADGYGVGVQTHAGIPWRLDRRPNGVRCPAPQLGQHTEEVLFELCGYSAEMIARLRDDKVLF